MFSSYFERLFYVCILISCIKATASEDFKDESLDRGAHSDRQGVWFGPRLGKRSQITNDDNRNTFWRLLEAADALRYYYDQLPYDMQAEQQRLARVAAGAPDKRTFDNAEFTPRLGRRRAPEILPMTSAEEDMYRPDPVMSNPMSNFFSPRLGRTIQFSPRLGRELNYDLYPDKIRVARSANITKAN